MRFKFEKGEFQNKIIDRVKLDILVGEFLKS